MIRTKDFLPFVRLFENAACAEMDDPDYFFPEGKAEEAERLPNLRIICGACIDRRECLAYAIKEEIPHGIWGGKTPSERGHNLQRDQKQERQKRIIRLRDQGISTEEIARKVGIRVTQVYRIFTEANRARKREDQSNQIRNTHSAASSSLLESQQ
jgi:WhiB family transcriptional regulator, redox-sensing transcriptional regulator